MAQALAHGCSRKGRRGREYRRLRTRPCEIAAQYGAARVPGLRRCRLCRGVRRFIVVVAVKPLSGRGGRNPRPGTSGGENRRLGGRGRHVRRLRADAPPGTAHLIDRSQHSRLGLRKASSSANAAIRFRMRSGRAWRNSSRRWGAYSDGYRPARDFEHRLRLRSGVRRHVHGGAGQQGPSNTAFTRRRLPDGE